MQHQKISCYTEANRRCAKTKAVHASVRRQKFLGDVRDLCARNVAWQVAHCGACCAADASVAECTSSECDRGWRRNCLTGVPQPLLSSTWSVVCAIHQRYADDCADRTATERACHESIVTYRKPESHVHHPLRFVGAHYRQRQRSIGLG